MNLMKTGGRIRMKLGGNPRIQGSSGIDCWSGREQSQKNKNVRFLGHTQRRDDAMMQSTTPEALCFKSGRLREQQLSYIMKYVRSINALLVPFSNVPKL